MTELVITRGLPASGKTTWARGWVAEDPSRVRVNRDDLRAMLYGRAVLEFAEEQRLTVVQHAAVRALLLGGTSVVVDDTHLRLRYARAWADLAAAVGVVFSVVELATPLEECLRRDAARAAAGERAVGERVLRELSARFGGPRLPVEPTTPVTVDVPTYVPDGSLPGCVLVDIDGTVALIGDRGRFEEHLVGRDLPNAVVIDVVRRLHASGHEIVFLSGRGSGCRAVTQAWLTEHVGAIWSGLFMRPQGDMRKDAVVKLELLFGEVAPRWAVEFVLDDRDQVVAAWRRAGLRLFQVAEGDF